MAPIGGPAEELGVVGVGLVGPGVVVDKGGVAGLEDGDDDMLESVTVRVLVKYVGMLVWPE
jgi:hypothetical protein